MVLDSKSSSTRRRMLAPLVAFSLLLILSTHAAQALGQVSSFCHHHGSTLQCEGFDSLDQLDFSWNQEIEQRFDQLVLKPAKAIRFDRTISLRGLKLADSFHVTLANFDGFEFHSNPFKAQKAWQLNVVNSTVQFYYNGNPFSDTSRSCQLYNTGLGADYVPLFAGFTSLSLDSVSVPFRQCGHVFQNAHILGMSLTNSNVVELKRNLLTNSRSLKHLKYLKISGPGVVNFEDLVDRLKHLEALELDLNMIKPAWLSHHQPAFLLLLDDSSSKSRSSEDEIICRFKSLAAEKPVVPIMLFNSGQECDCGQIWLLQSYFSNLDLASSGMNSSNDNVESEARQWSTCQSLTPHQYQSKFQSCSFPSRLAQCDGDGDRDREEPSRAVTETALQDSADKNSKRQNINFVIFAVLAFVVLFIVLFIRWFTFDRIKRELLNLFYKLTGRPRPEPHTEMGLTSFANPMASSYPQPSSSSTSQRNEEFSMGAMASRVSVVDESNE